MPRARLPGCRLMGRVSIPRDAAAVPSTTQCAAFMRLFVLGTGRRRTEKSAQHWKRNSIPAEFGLHATFLGLKRAHIFSFVTNAPLLVNRPSVLSQRAVTLV